MTNPNSTVGTNAGYNGRTTPNAFNAVMQLFEDPGIIGGWNCRPKTGMTVQIGGQSGAPDVAIAEDNAGNRTAITNRLATPVEITLDAAPATNNRYDAIIAYVNNPQQGTGASDVDFPSQVGIIAVKGTVAASPSYPTDAQIQSGITADGGNGATAYWVKLAHIYVGQGVTNITAGNITQGATANVPFTLADNSVTTAKIAGTAVTTAKIADAAITPAKMSVAPGVTTTVVTNYGTISASTSKVMASSGYIIGKALVSADDKSCYVSLTNDSTFAIGGIPYAYGSVTNLQIAFCIPVFKGQTIYFICSASDAHFEEVKLIKNNFDVA